jgi:uncharacterized membrane protein YgaE (UPF0421/DUF939 family)
MHRNNRQKILEQQSPLIKKLSPIDQQKNENTDNTQSTVKNVVTSSDCLFYNGKIEEIRLEKNQFFVFME